MPGRRFRPENGDALFRADVHGSRRMGRGSIGKRRRLRGERALWQASVRTRAHDPGSAERTSMTHIISARPRRFPRGSARMMHRAEHTLRLVFSLGPETFQEKSKNLAVRCKDRNVYSAFLRATKI